MASRPWVCPRCMYAESHPGPGITLRHCGIPMRPSTAAEYRELVARERPAERVVVPAFCSCPASEEPVDGMRVRHLPGCPRG